VKTMPGNQGLIFHQFEQEQYVSFEIIKPGTFKEFQSRNNFNNFSYLKLTALISSLEEACKMQHS
jgi:hypothetical protein